MKLGETKEFLVLRKVGTDQFYIGVASTTDDLLKAKLFTGRDELDDFTTLVNQASIQVERKSPLVERVRIRIKVEQL